MGRLWRRHRVRLLLIAASAAFVGLLNSTAGPFRSVEGRGVSASEANARLWNCLVPDTAADVWYVSAFRGTRVECTLAQEDFEEWCRQRGWEFKPIDPGRPAWFHSERDGVREVGRGLRFSTRKGDLGFSGCYDAENGRAFVCYSGG